MNHHQRTFDFFVLLGETLDTLPVESMPQPPSMLPTAVTQWYQVQESSSLWKWYTASDYSAVRLDVELSEWYLPDVCFDMRGWIKGPILPVVYETQGCCWWGVLLDGSDDPSVVVAESDRGERWDYFAGSFSDFVFARVFDFAKYAKAEVQRNVEVDEEVNVEQLRELQKEFHVGPTTRVQDRCFTYRFSKEGQYFFVINYERDNRSLGYSCWYLWAKDNEHFQELINTLRRIYPRMEGVIPDRTTLYLRGTQSALEYAKEREDLPF